MGDGQVTVVVRPGERRAGGWGKRRVNETTNRSWNVSIALLGCRRWSAGIRRNPPEYSPRCQQSGPGLPKNARLALADDVLPALPDLNLPAVKIEKGEYVFWSDYHMMRSMDVRLILKLQGLALIVYASIVMGTGC